MKMKGKIKLEHYGVWKGRDVYTITHAEYVRREYYEPDVSSAFWITDDNYFVADNKIVGKIVRGPEGVSIDDKVKIAGDTYYYAPLIEIKDVKLINTKTNEVLMESSAEEILNSVYTSKLWDEI